MMTYAHRSALMRLAYLITLGAQKVTADDVTCSASRWRKLVMKFRLKASHPYCFQTYWTPTKFSQAHAAEVVALREANPRQTLAARELRRKLARARKAGLLPPTPAKGKT